MGYFDLDGAPDIVTFSKKMLTGGFYNKPELSPKQSYRIFNTWVGDPGKLILLDAVLKTIKQAACWRILPLPEKFCWKVLKTWKRSFPNTFTLPAVWEPSVQSTVT